MSVVASCLTVSAAFVQFRHVSSHWVAGRYIDKARSYKRHSDHRQRSTEPASVHSFMPLCDDI